MNSRHLYVLLLTWIICSSIIVCVEARVGTLWPYRGRRRRQTRRRERVPSPKNKLLKQSKFRHKRAVEEDDDDTACTHAWRLKAHPK
ncbi:hypothetical protein ABFA07_009738 [Porites harrisoni]